MKGESTEGQQFKPRMRFITTHTQPLAVKRESIPIADGVLDPSSDQHVMHNTWPSNACAKSSGYSGELQGSDYGNLLLKLRLACCNRGVCVPSSKITCATQAAHNCIPACVSCERPRGCSGELQGSDNGN